MSEELKIQFGCGGNKLAGWRNHDRDVDVTKRLPYADGVADVVFIEHCLEHVIAPDCLRFMDEAHRILKPGGTLRICVPILDRIKDREHARDLVLGHGHCVVFNLSNMIRLLLLAGFETVSESLRAPCDSHHKVIGIAKDDLETLRVEAKKSL